MASDVNDFARLACVAAAAGSLASRGLARTEIVYAELLNRWELFAGASVGSL
jgi:hypothetical protein